MQNKLANARLYDIINRVAEIFDDTLYDALEDIIAEIDSAISDPNDYPLDYVVSVALQINKFVSEISEITQKYYDLPPF